MESLEAFVRLLAALVTASLAPAPQYVDPGADLRLPLLSEAAEPASDLEGVARWQQVDELPSDLPDDMTQSGDDEILDSDLVPADSAVPPGDDPLDAPLDNGMGDDDLVEDDLAEDEFADDASFDDELAAAQLEDDEPLDAELDDGFDEGFDEEFPEDDLIDEPSFADEPLDAPQADTFVDDTASVAPVSAPSSSTRAVLPEGFGSGQTIVSNPPAGADAAQVPSDCDSVVQNGRAVVGVGCGSDDGPWWAPLVGQAPPAGPSGGAGGADFPFNQAGPPPGFPFDDDSAPFASDGGGVVIAAPSRSNTGRETVRVIEVDGELRQLRDNGNVERTNLVRTERIERQPERDNERREAIRQRRADLVAGMPGTRQAAQSSRPGLRTATQSANARKATRANARSNASAKQSSERPGAGLNPCQNAKRIAQSPKSAKRDKQLAKARANCRQFKKSQRESGR